VIARSHRWDAAIRSSPFIWGIGLRSLVLSAVAATRCTVLVYAMMVCATLVGEARGDVAGFASDPALVVTQRVILRGLDFGVDTAYIQPVSAGTLEVVAGGLKLRPDVRVMIEGYTDSAGSESYNQELSRQRAESVKRILVGYGVEPERLQAIGLGESNPIAPNEDAQGRTLNRRVELVLYEKRLNP
jgi:outer membrane protein OmpA-like peptidoglycan-associated protein